MEISGGVAKRIPEYAVYGTKGTLILENNTISMRYLDPEAELKEIKADPSTPGSGAAFGNEEKLVWKEDTVELSKEDKTDVIWDYFFDAYRLGKPYPITSHQALEVVRALENAKIGTEFQ
jgi:hypothetical protein